MRLSSGGVSGALARTALLALGVWGASACGGSEPLFTSSGTSSGGGGAGGTSSSGGSGGATTTTGGSGGVTTGGTGGTGGNPGAAADALFDPDGIARIDLTLAQVAKNAIDADPYSYVHGDLKVQLTDGQTITVPDIGVRLKGKYGSFRTLDQKAAFLLKTNEFQKGQELLGMKKLALNNMVQDPSMIHEQLAYTLFRAANVGAPRTSYARVFVNDELYGLYTTIEVLDNSELLKTWYGDDEGNLYEGAYGSDLETGLLGSFDQDSGTDVGFADLQDLTNALDGMNDPDTFLTDASVVFDMDRVLDFTATEIFIGHWDGYAWTRNNYYLYRGPDSRWAFMPWGTDQTFSDFLDPFGGGGRVEQMCDASLPCRAKLASAFQEVSARVPALGLVSRCDQLLALIDVAMQQDPRKEYDPGTVYANVEATKAFLQNRPADIEAKLVCTDPSDVDGDGDGAPGCGFDCDDGDPDVYPGAAEACNVKDDNCDGQIDEDPMCPSCVTQPAADGGTYAFCFKAKTYPEAEADCVAQGGHLASIHDQAQQDEVAGGAYALMGGHWWIGLSDVATEGTFAWEDGTPLDFDGWTGGEPNDAGGIEDCAHLADWAGGLWNDIGCDNVQPYVCALP